MNHYDCPHGNTEKFCRSCEIATLRRDLATRDRELAEARAGWGDAQNMLFDVADQRDQARAALAEKERELAEILAMEDRNAPLWAKLEDVARGTLTLGEKIREAKLAAAQEEAKGLRSEVTAARAVLKDLAAFSMSAQSDPNRLAEQYRGDLAAVCNRAMAAMDAMEVRIAARQQQPDGKKEDGNG